MSGMKFWLKVSNPIQVIIGGTAAWIAALLSDGPDWFNTHKIFAGLVMSLSIWGASVWHHGARADVYAKKHWDLIIVKNPKPLLCVGGLLFLSSIALAWLFLSGQCVAIAIINAITIFIYARFLDRYWPWKNLSIAGICITPLLLGWFSGHRLNPIVPPLILAAFFFYLSREIFKDVVDIEANRGKRFTMVMSVGNVAAVRTGGIILTGSLFFILYSLKYAPDSILVWTSSFSGVAWLSWFVIKSVRGVNIASKFIWMDVGVASILFSLLGSRMVMY